MRQQRLFVRLMLLGVVFLAGAVYAHAHGPTFPPDPWECATDPCPGHCWFGPCNMPAPIILLTDHAKPAILLTDSAKPVQSVKPVDAMVVEQARRPLRYLLELH